MPLPVQQGGFRTFERAGWQRIVAQYNQDFGPLTTQAIEPLLDAAEVTSGVRVLDVATGPGYVAAAAGRRGARAVGLDFARAMVAAARRRIPAINFLESDAEALPFPSESFDAVVVNFGLLHFERPEQAVREAHRVLVKPGRLGFTVWAGLEECVGHKIVFGAVQAHGNQNVSLPPGPPIFRFSDPVECRNVLRAAGFETTTIVKIPQVWRLSSTEALLEATVGSTVRMAGLLRAQEAEAMSAIRAAIVEAAIPYRRGDTLELPMPALVVSAAKL